VAAVQIGAESTCTCLFPSCGPEGTHCLFCGHLWPRGQVGGRHRGTNLPADALMRLWIEGWDGPSVRIAAEWWKPLP
jgi:hypothetical protein